jgi:uncharacterized protein YndB with AHSA1/START domain
MNKTIITAEPGQPFIDIERDFDAPREKVFKALTSPEAIPHWWGPSNLSTEISTLEARAGGSWRFVQKDTQGNTFPFHGVYHEFSPERTIQTFEWDGLPERGHVILEKLTLEEAAGKTKLKIHMSFMSISDRDGMLQSGMEKGMNESHDRLAAFLAKS